MFAVGPVIGRSGPRCGLAPHDIFYFENACQPQVFVGSADWLPRNFFRRIETVFPVEDGNVRERIVRGILGIVLADNTKARFLRPAT